MSFLVFLFGLGYIFRRFNLDKAVGKYSFNPWCFGQGRKKRDSPVYARRLAPLGTVPFLLSFSWGTFQRFHRHVFARRLAVSCGSPRKNCWLRFRQSPFFAWQMQLIWLGRKKRVQPPFYQNKREWQSLFFGLLTEPLEVVRTTSASLSFLCEG